MIVADVAGKGFAASLIMASVKAMLPFVTAEGGVAESLAQLMQDENIEIRKFPDEVLVLLRSIARDVVTDLMASDQPSAKIGEAYFEYLEKVAANSRITEKAYLDTRS